MMLRLPGVDWALPLICLLLFMSNKNLSEIGLTYLSAEHYLYQAVSLYILALAFTEKTSLLKNSVAVPLPERIIVYAGDAIPHDKLVSIFEEFKLHLLTDILQPLQVLVMDFLKFLESIFVNGVRILIVKTSLVSSLHYAIKFKHEWSKLGGIPVEEVYHLLLVDFGPDSRAEHLSLVSIIEIVDKLRHI